MEKKGKKVKRRPTKIIEGLTVYEHDITYFNDFLTEYIGATWKIVKNNLYEEGYNAREVMEYRDKMLAEFKDICKRNNLHGII